MEFPAEVDLRPFTRPTPAPDAMEIDEAPASPILYELRGVVNHSGAIDQGHYTAFIHPEATEQWYKCDDHKIFHANRNDVFGSQAYLLFYQLRKHN